jgi:hypothetical protein
VGPVADHDVEPRGRFASAHGANEEAQDIRLGHESDEPIAVRDGKRADLFQTIKRAASSMGTSGRS